MPQIMQDGKLVDVTEAWVATNLPKVDPIEGAVGNIPAGLAKSPSHANDAAAAARGVKVGAIYRSGSQVMVRIA